jgi:hypothetical protein
MIVLLATPLNVSYDIHWLKHKGEGILNSSSTDTGSWSMVEGTLRGGMCDAAIPGDLMIVLREAGWSGMTDDLTRNARKSHKGPLLKILPIRDYGLLEWGKRKGLFSEQEQSKTSSGDNPH